jgi:thiol-disulfide isomerase/thioredoxin
VNTEKKESAQMKHSLSVQVWIRCFLGVAAVLGVAVIATGLKTSFPRFSFIDTVRAQEHLIGALHPEKLALLRASATESQTTLADEGPLPDFGGAVGWLNSAPLSRESLRGKIVLVNFWTYSCINSLRELPYMKAWAAKYKDAGLVVIGVHAPEFGFERERANVENAVRELSVAYPVAIDSNHRIWDAFNNEYWPADYFIDGKGQIRYHHFGEGDYAESEHVIQDLLKANGATGLDESTVRIPAGGVEAPPSGDVQSPETYVGYRQAQRFASPERVAQDSQKTYSPPATPSLNQWGLGGSWNVGAESGVLQSAPGMIVFRFHSRDLHMVLGPTKNGKPIRFKVKLDGIPPGDNCGIDSTPDGNGEIREPRLYQLIRQKGRVEDRTFEIEFLDPGVQAFSFTFG